MDSDTCYNSIEDEVLKLMCLMTRCSAQLKQEGKDLLSREYVLEKVTRILQGIPIILDSDSRKMYYSIKMNNE